MVFKFINTNCHEIPLSNHKKIRVKKSENPKVSNLNQINLAKKDF